MFFKGYINPILSGEFEHCRALQVAVVYSGGDDVFLVGAWTDVLEGARRIREALRRYTCGALTISAGIGIYGDHFPIRQAASLTAGLEDEAKSLPHKDGIASLPQETDTATHGIPIWNGSAAKSWSLWSDIFPPATANTARPFFIA